MNEAFEMERLDYQVDGQRYHGILFLPFKAQQPRPLVMVVPEFWGRNDYSERRAQQMAQLGYAGFAIDLYGDGRSTDDRDQATEWMNEAVADPRELRNRYLAALHAARQHAGVDSSKVAALGYCFGGAVGMSMARMGVEHDALCAYHAGVTGLAPIKQTPIKTPMYLFMGGADPMAPMDKVNALVDEMREAGAEVTLQVYEDALHAFTNPIATQRGREFDMPLAYDAKADEDSFEKTRVFLKEKFGA